MKRPSYLPPLLSAPCLACASPRLWGCPWCSPVSCWTTLGYPVHREGYGRHVEDTRARTVRAAYLPSAASRLKAARERARQGLVA